MLETLLAGAVRAGTPVLYACLGEVVTERCGIINLGTEGAMLTGALAAFAATAATGNPLIGALAGGLAGALICLAHAWMVIWGGANQIASGLTLMTLALGFTSFFGGDYVSVQVHGFNPLPIPGLQRLPLLGPMLFRHDLLTYLSMLLVPLLWYLIQRTKIGLALRAVGERPEVAFACGYHPHKIQIWAVTIGGFLSGLGGAQLSVAYTLNWVENITQGRGIVAVALVIFASWSPLRAMLGAYLFGGAMALQLLFQAKGAGVSPFLLSMTPYVLTLVVLLFVGQRKHAMPEALKKVFEGIGR